MNRITHSISAKGSLISLISLPLLILSSCNAETPAAQNRTLVPGKQAGGIHAATQRSDLDSLFGAENVKDATLPGPEGTEYKGTVIFPERPEDRIELIWSDEEKPAIDFVRLAGTKSHWRSKEGLALGLRLKEVEKLNGKPFQVYGFEWDYGGFIVGFDGGRLDSKSGNTFSVRFSTTEGDDTSRIAGDEIFSSSHEDFQKINPIISEITLRLSPPEAAEIDSDPSPDNPVPPSGTDSTRPEEMGADKGKKPTITKNSSDKPFDIPTEVVAFLQGLIESDSDVAAKYESLIAKTKEEAGGRFSVGPLVAIEWLVPSRNDEFRDGKGSRTGEIVYLVQQQIIFGFNGGYAVDDNVIAQIRAEFEEDHSYDREKDTYTFSQSTLNLTFEGFVTLSVAPK